jgi:hypothetical protein
MTREDLKKLLERGEVIIDSHTHVGISPKFYYQFGYPYALSLEDLIIRMELSGIDYAVVFPFVDLHFMKQIVNHLRLKLPHDIVFFLTK